MKKILTIILTCFLTLSLAGCSSKKNNDDILTFFNALDNITYNERFKIKY